MHVFISYFTAADVVFMVMGLAVAVLMIVMGGGEERRTVDRLDGPEPSPGVKHSTGRTRRR
jgi:hypothetical protein